MMTMYEFVGGKFNGLIFTKEHIEAIGNGKYSEDLSDERARGCLVHREELDNQPLVDGYIGPMWDGIRYLMPNGRLEREFRLSEDERQDKECVAILRYETQAIYDMMSR